MVYHGKSPRGTPHAAWVAAIGQRAKESTAAHSPVKNTRQTDKDQSFIQRACDYHLAYLESCATPSSPSGIARAKTPTGSSGTGMTSSAVRALVVACGKGDIMQIHALIRFYGAQNVVECHEASTMRTALHISAMQGHANVCELLLENGAYANARDRNRMTPLSLAALHGRVGTVRTLLNLHDDPDDEESRSPTALHFACKSGHVEVARVLISHSPELVHSADTVGQTCLHWVVASPKDVRRTEMLELLLRNGADPNMADYAGRTPLRQAAQSGCRQTVTTLMKHSATTGKNRQPAQSSQVKKDEEHSPWDASDLVAAHAVNTEDILDKDTARKAAEDLARTRKMIEQQALEIARLEDSLRKSFR